MASERVIFGTSLILDGSSDWFLWYNRIKNRAVGHEIWDLVDPEAPNERSLSPPPKFPTIQEFRQLSLEDQHKDSSFDDLLTFLTFEYDIEERKYSERRDALRSLFNEIQGSISEKCFIYMHECSTPYKALKSLKRCLEPSYEEQYFAIDKRYRTLCAGKSKSQNLDQWLLEWKLLSVEATRIEHRDFKCTRARRNFIKSTYSTDRDWSIAAYKWEFPKSTTRKLPRSSFRELVDQFELSCKQNEMGAPPTTSPASLFNPPHREHPKRCRDQRQTPKCPIEDLYHWYTQCPYLNESSRPPNWTPDLALTAKAEQALEDSLFRDKVERAIARSKRFKN